MTRTQPRWGLPLDPRLLALAIVFVACHSRVQSQPLFNPPTSPVANVVATPITDQTSTSTTSPLPAAQNLPDEMLLDSPRPRTLEESQVIARVNGSVVLACEVRWLVNIEIENRLESIPAEHRSKIPAEQIELMRQAMMRQLLLSVIDRKIKYTDFRRSVPQANLKEIHAKLDVPFGEKEIPRLLKAFEVNNVQELETKLHAVGTSLAEQREMFYEQMISHSWIREQLNYDETVTHDDMLEYYQAHLADYEFPTQVRWEELMVRSDRFPGNNWEERKSNAYRQLAELGNNLWQRAQATPAGEQIFAELAKTHSHGVTASEGGKYDWTTQGALKAAMVDAAIFTLAPGQMSDILASDEGFHIVRVLERKDAGRTPFTEVQTEITKTIVDQRFDAAAKEKIDTIRREARIWTIYDGDTTAEALFKRPNGAVRK